MSDQAIQIREVTPQSVTDDTFLLDVREPGEWIAGHVPTAIHIPMGQLLDRLDEIPKDQPIAVLCRSGARSAQVTAYLVFQGWANVVNVAGGIQAWQRTGLPLVSETNAVPRVV